MNISQVKETFVEPFSRDLANKNQLEYILREEPFTGSIKITVIRQVKETTAAFYVLCRKLVNSGEIY